MFPGILEDPKAANAESKQKPDCGADIISIAVALQGFRHLVCASLPQCTCNVQ